MWPSARRRFLGGAAILLMIIGLLTLGQAVEQDPIVAETIRDDGDPPDSSDANDTDQVFCQGAMAMFMDGFHATLFRRSQQANDTPQCLIYLVSGWVLDDADQFKGAVVYSFLLAILMEALSAIRGAASHYVRRPWSRFVCLTLIYGVQALLGYLLMFLAMTFAVEILLAAVVGLSVGNLAFFRYQDFQPHRKRRPVADAADRQPLLEASAENVR